MAKKFNPGYKERLKGPDLLRYNDLIKKISDIDPYEILLDATSNSVSLIPDVNLLHISNYLVNSANPVTMERMNAYKSTEAYAFFTAGFVMSVIFYDMGSNVICLAKVKHSQTLGAGTKPLLPWVVAKKSGDILGAWCTCKAGCGEVCSHVGAVLYSLEFGNFKKGALACTSKNNAWLPPSLKEVPPAQIRDIDFTTPKSKRNILMSANSEDNPPVMTRKRDSIPAEKLNSFLHDLHEAGHSASIFRVLPRYCKEYAPKELSSLPKNLTELFDVSLAKLSLDELIVKGRDAFPAIKVSLEQSTEIEKRTRKQADSLLWKVLRAGRITASVIYSATHTSIDTPSITTVKNICYPFSKTYVSYWMKRGKRLETMIRDKYYETMNVTHINVQVKPSGLWIPPEVPFIGATPDGFVKCDCHGVGIIEMKAPKFQNEDEDFIPSNHLYQIQIQLFCTSHIAKYCDYIVYHPNGTTTKRVYPDPSLQESILAKAEIFFKRVILPELLGRYFSSWKSVNDDINDSDEEADAVRLVCMCQKPWEEPMVRCLDPGCTFEWFHARCFNIKRLPKKWVCTGCKLRASNAASSLIDS